MKAQPECVVCMMKQALNTVRLVTANAATQKKVMSAVARRIPSLSYNQTPAQLSQPAYDIVAAITGVKDPYAEQRRRTNRIAMRMATSLRRLIAHSRDPLSTALHAAVAGNVIDMGIGHKFSIRRDVHDILARRFATDATERFRRQLKPGKRLLYLGDNAGEIVFDRLLVELLVSKGIDVTFVVKSGPIINDAVMADADEVGLTRITRVITTGSNDIGVNWKRISAEFRREVKLADIILAKGHGNYENCHDHAGNFYFLLKAKCDIVARQLGVQLGDIVFKHG